MEPVVQRFSQVVHRLVAGERATGKLIGLRDPLALVELTPKRVVVLLCAGPEPAALQRTLAELLERARGMHIDLVMVGGGPGERALLEQAQPRVMLRRFVRAYHLDDAGELWVGRATRIDSAVGDALCAVARGEGPPAIGPEDLRQHLHVPSEEDRAMAREHEGFVQRIRARRPVATWSVLLSLVGVFGLQAYWGGTELVPTLVRMGANTPAALAGEPWRLVSSAFLHAGPWHLLINAYVLFALGGFVERILGWQRFLLLYGASALGGGLASAAMLDAGISVGASGAIWGLFGAAGALAWHPRGMLPRSLVPRMRRITLVNLLINLSVSFLPQVDLMAHVGGGMVGAAFAASGLLTRGLPALQQDSAAPRAPRLLTASAAVVAVLLAGSVAIGWWTARPWALVDELRWTRHVLEADVSIELPEALGSPTRERGEPGETVWWIGDLGQDPLQLAITIRPAIELTGEALDAAVDALRDGPFAAPEGAEPLGERTHPDDRHVAWEQRFHVPGRMILIYRLMRLEHAEVFVELAAWQDAPPPWSEHALARVLGSLRSGLQM